MIGVFTQVWLWSVLAFALGVLLTWVWLARPLRKRIAELEERLAAPLAAEAPRRGEQPEPTPATYPAPEVHAHREPLVAEPEPERGPSRPTVSVEHPPRGGEAVTWPDQPLPWERAQRQRERRERSATPSANAGARPPAAVPPPAPPAPAAATSAPVPATPAPARRTPIAETGRLTDTTTVFQRILPVEDEEQSLPVEEPAERPGDAASMRTAEPGVQAERPTAPPEPAPADTDLVGRESGAYSLRGRLGGTVTPEPGTVTAPPELTRGESSQEPEIEDPEQPLAGELPHAAQPHPQQPAMRQEAARRPESAPRPGDRRNGHSPAPRVVRTEPEPANSTKADSTPADSRPTGSEPAESAPTDEARGQRQAAAPGAVPAQPVPTRSGPAWPTGDAVPPVEPSAQPEPEQRRTGSAAGRGAEPARTPEPREDRQTAQRRPQPRQPAVAQHPVLAGRVGPVQQQRTEGWTPFGPGSALPRPDGSAPDPDFEVKAVLLGRRYFTAESPEFARTRAQVWFRRSTDAQRAGFTPADAKK